MGTIHYLNERNEEEPMTELKIIRGGLDTNGTEPPENWLAAMKVGTTFAVESKFQRENFMVMTLTVQRKYKKYVRLYDELSDKFFGDVNPNRFVNAFNLLEVLYEPEEDEIPE